MSELSTLIPLISHVSAQVTEALVSAVWQGALLAGLIGLCMRLFPGLSAAARSVVWLNVFILVALLHVGSFVRGSAAEGIVTPHSIQADFRWSLAVAGIWLAFSLFRALQLALSVIQLRALADHAVQIKAGPDLEPLLLAPGNRRVRLCTSEEVARPSVLGFFRPRILLPPALLQGLSPAELRQVVIHEMEHLRRGDDWTNLLQKLALVLFPLNPALLWVERRLCAERELACDDSVLRSGSGRKAYALCLTHLAEFSLVRRGFSLALGAWERRPELVRRVQRILYQPARTMGRRPAMAVCGLLIAGVFACTLTMAHAPQLVSFVTPADAVQQVKALPSQDSATLVSTVGSGRAHMVNAVTRPGGQPQLVQAKWAVPNTVQSKTTMKSKKLPRLQPARLSELRTSLQPNSDDFSARAVMVMAQWAEMQNAARAAYAVSREQQFHRPNIVSAVYVVRTPTGWLIIQI